MDQHYRLSICMMVKNEENNIERCLDSLRNLLKNPLVELIIVDTGSTDNTVNIAKKYTDKLYFHEWNNNFSEMRNISISYAKGNWLLLLDADECVESKETLYKLLMEYDIEEYNTIQLKIKSYANMIDETNYSILSQPRVFKNDGDFKYEGTVHNQPKFKAPILDADIFIGHYGYIKSDRELMDKKFQRTANILKKELEKDPNNIYYQFQLSVSYSMYDEHKRALEEIRKVYQMLKNKSKKEKVAYVYMYGMYSRTSFANNEIEETMKVCKEGIQLQPEYIDLYFILANAALIIGERAESIKYFKKYLELFNKYDNLSIAKDPSFIIYNIDEDSVSNAYSNLGFYYYDKKEYIKSYNYAKNIKEGNQKIELMCKVLLKLENYEELKDYYDTLKDEDERKQFTLILENEIKDYDDDEQIEQISILFKYEDDEYGLYSKIRLEKNNKEYLIKEFFTKYNVNNLPIFYCNLFVNLKENNRLMISLFKKINDSILRKHIGYLIEEYNDMMDYFTEYLISAVNHLRINDYQSNRVYCIIASSVLILSMSEAKNTKQLLDEKYTYIFNEYLEKGFNCLEYIYNMRKIRMIYDTLNITEDKFFMIMYLVKGSIEKENFELAISYIREALKQFPHMAIALQGYQKEVFKDIKI